MKTNKYTFYMYKTWNDIKIYINKLYLFMKILTYT